MQFKKLYQTSKNKKNLLILLFFSLVNFSPYLIFYDTILGGDWDYFNSLSHFINLSIFQYHQIPLHDPYVCGGVDFLANPQGYLFSPLILLNLLFDPHWYNILSLIICSMIGGLGMIKLLEYFSVEKKLTLFGALIFISSNWFAFHFIEGHIAFRTLYLIPWATYLIFCLERNIKYFLYFSLLMAFFILDGGIYAFNFSLLLFAIGLCLKKPRLNEILKITKNDWRKVLLIFLAFILLILPKILPTLLALGARKAEIHFFTFSLYDSYIAFFYQFNKLGEINIANDPGFTDYGIHEYACYIGFLWMVPAILALTKKERPKNFKIILGFLLICLWIGVGFGWIMNPWTIFMMTPFLNQSHIQSRFLIFFWMFFVIALMKIVANLKNRNLWLSLILIELILVGLYPVFFEFKSIQKSTKYSDFKHFSTKNILETSDYIAKPEIYFIGDKSSKKCYEPGKKITNVLASDDEKYLGEFYSLNGKGKFTLKERNPREISGSFAGKAGEIFIFNTNYLMGWKAENKGLYNVKEYNGLLAVEFLKDSAEIHLKYRPSYIIFIMLSFALGILMYGLLVNKARNLPEQTG